MATEPQTDAQVQNTEQTSDSVDNLLGDARNRLSRIVGQASKATLMTSSVFALVIGGVAAWMFANWFGLAPLFFLGGAAISWKYLMGRGNAWLASSRGCYTVALQLFFLAPVFYIPVLFRSASGTGLEAAGTFAGSFLGIIIWGFVMAFIAAFVAVAGFLLGRKGKSAREDVMVEASG